MKKDNASDHATRVKRPRIHRATVPGESEKVDIQYEMTHEYWHDKPVRDDKKLTYTIRSENPKNS